MIRVRADSIAVADIRKWTVSFTLDQFAAECHRILAADSGLEGRKRVRALLGEVCSDEAFVATYLGAIRQWPAPGSEDTRLS